jgi:hypothetical protein
MSQRFKKFLQLELEDWLTKLINKGIQSAEAGTERVLLREASTKLAREA